MLSRTGRYHRPDYFWREAINHCCLKADSVVMSMNLVNMKLQTRHPMQMYDNYTKRDYDIRYFCAQGYGVVCIDDGGQVECVPRRQRHRSSPVF